MPVKKSDVIYLKSRVRAKGELKDKQLEVVKLYEDRKIRDLTVALTLVEQLSTNRSHVGTIKKIGSY